MIEARNRANSLGRLRFMAHSTKVTDAEVAKRLAAIDYAQGSIAHLAPDRNLADELVADRRAEARAENVDAGAGQRSGRR
jgi:hypothetical protein